MDGPEQIQDEYKEAGSRCSDWKMYLALFGSLCGGRDWKLIPI
jgi:hypothetical protein